jgi:D-alanine transaminase
VPALADRERGVRIITVPEVRWGRCDIKSVNLLPNVLAKQAAKSRGAYEAVFVRSDGLVTEGSSTNVFIVKDGRIITREEGPHILSGITRGIVLEIAASRKIPCREGHLKLEDVLRADEVFLTGTTSEIMFVVGVNDVVIGSGAPGRIARLLYDAYRRRIDEASG